MFHVASVIVIVAIKVMSANGSAASASTAASAVKVSVVVVFVGVMTIVDPSISVQVGVHGALHLFSQINVALRVLGSRGWRSD